MLTPDALFLLAVAFVLALGLGALRLSGRRPPPRTDAGPALAEPPRPQKRCQEPFTAQRPGGCSAQKVPDTFFGPARTEDPWSRIWPVRESRRAGTTIGLIAVGRLADAAVLTSELRHTIGPLLSLCWQHVAAREQLNLVRRTDQASGVLTRSDFFVLAHEALCESYSANEPVVLAVLVLRRPAPPGRRTLLA